MYMINKLKICWKDGNFVEIVLDKNPVAEYYADCIRRLKNINLEINTRHNVLDPLRSNLKKIKHFFVARAGNVGIIVDYKKLNNQKYLNELHEQYTDSGILKKNDHDWFVFHDYLHLIEDVLQRSKKNASSIFFDYKYYAGPLIKKFDRSLLKYSKSNWSEGDCYIMSSEKGKDLYRFFLDKESTDMTRMCNIAKPWLFLRPVLNVCVLPFNARRPEKDNKFCKWLGKYKDTWCQHWGIHDWRPEETEARIPVGKINDVKLLKERFSVNNYPERIVLN